MQSAILSFHTGAPGHRAVDRTLCVSRTLTWAEWRDAYMAATRNEFCPWAEDETETPEGRFTRYWADALAGKKRNDPRMWFGMPSKDILRETLHTGGHEHFTGPVRRALAELRAETHAPRASRHVAGAWDIPAVIAGQPLPAVARTRKPAPARELEILVALTAEQRTNALAPLAARLAKACTDYSLRHGAIRAAVTWINASYSEGVYAEDRVRGAIKGSLAALKRNAETCKAAREGLERDAWRDQWEALGRPAFNQVCQRLRVWFDPTNLQEVAAALSPTIKRWHVVGTCARGWSLNHARTPPALECFNPKAYRVILDANDMAATNASLCAALADC